MIVCFLLSHIPNPRMNKRIAELKEAADVYVICTRRASQNIWEPKQDVPHYVYEIDLPSSKHIIRRFFLSMKFRKKALKRLVQIKPDVIYTEGLDMLITAGMYRKKQGVRIVYEVADLREMFISKPKGLMDRVIKAMICRKERKSFRDVDRLVVTSPKFYEQHYCNLISKERVRFIPNAPIPEIFSTYKRHEGEFTVGFIGCIRYIKQMQLLVDAAAETDCKILFAGAGGTSSDYRRIREYCSGKDYVRFLGRYDYDSQIAEVYGMVDCVFAVYDADNPNVRIALPNKLYEAIICGLPVIVAKGTYLEEIVRGWGVGVGVSHTDKTELETVLRRMKTDREYYNCFVKACQEHKCEGQNTPGIVKFVLY